MRIRPFSLWVMRVIPANFEVGLKIMQEQKLNLSIYTLPELIDMIKDEIDSYEYDFKKHLILLKDQNFNPMGYVRLPLHYQLNDHLDILDTQANALYLSVESGNAAICMMEGTENIYHTTFSAYMTRKKQGFSQIKYLNKKGKSRAGSRVRLAETVEFFENINTTMNDLWEEFMIARLALDCNKTLLPYLLQSKVPFPVDKKDPVLYKIPLHIAQSNYTNLDAAIEKLKAPLLLFDEQYADELRDIFSV